MQSDRERLQYIVQKAQGGLTSSSVLEAKACEIIVGLAEHAIDLHTIVEGYKARIQTLELLLKVKQ